MWTSKNYWWAVPILILTFTFLSACIYNFFPIWTAFKLQQYLIMLYGLLFLPVGFLALGLFAIWIFKFRFRHKNLPKPLKFGIVFWACFLAVLPLVIIAVRILPTPIPPDSDLQLFSAQKWNEGDAANILDGKNGSVRQQMLIDLIDSHLPEKTCSEIESILGYPLSSPLGKPGISTACAHPAKNRFLYNLGPKRTYIPFDFGRELLEIKFNASGEYLDYDYIIWAD